jgi:hypothetical protein
MPTDVAIADFVDNLFILWDEILGVPAKESGPTWVLDLDTGWAQSLAAVTAAGASRPIAPGGTSIAAQTAHAAYYLETFEAIIQNRHERADWPGSFQPATVDDAEWAHQKARLFSAAARVGALMRGNPQWRREHVGGAMANLTHLAYHLGAVRQMLRLVAG